MTKFITIAILFLTTFSMWGQNHNQEIYDYAVSQIGNKVGNGRCSDLVNHAYSSFSTYKPWKKISKHHWQVDLGNVVSKDSIMKGDIVLFVFYDKASGKELGSHVGIVYQVVNDSVTILNQNYHVYKVKDSRVVLVGYKEFIDPNPMIRQTVEYFRPY